MPLYAEVEESDIKVKEKSIMSYDIAKDMLIENNSTLKKNSCKKEEHFTVIAIQFKLQRINTEGRNVNMFGMDFYFLS